MERREEEVGLEWNHGKGEEGVGLKWNNGKEGGRGGVRVESWKGWG